MPRTIPRVVLAARTRAGRKQQRAGVRLRDFTVTAKTKSRYEVAVGRILPFLESHDSLHDLDGVVCDWIELEWSKGEAVNSIADCLSGLHFLARDQRNPPPSLEDVSSVATYRVTAKSTTYDSTSG